MAKEIAIGKRATISQAEQYILLAILGAAMFLGVAISLVVHFSDKISYNSNVIAEEEKAIAAYSSAIANIGVCPKPKDKNGIYTDAELKSCNPDDVDVSSVPGTLRANILENMAANSALNSVPNENNKPECISDETYKELNAMYNEAKTKEELTKATNLIQSCSALRIIPDALPAYKNEEALLSSLNKIFILSDWEPESLTPTGETSTSLINSNLNAFSVRLSIEANSSTVMTVLNNIEHSIREFNIERATIEWSGNDALTFNAQATAFYMTPSVLGETEKKVKPGDAPSSATPTKDSSAKGEASDEEELD